MNQKIKNPFPAKKILLLLVLVLGVFIFGENSKAADDCTASSSWGAKCLYEKIDWAIDEYGYCYSGKCYPTGAHNLNDPCGDDEGSTCQKKESCKDKDNFLIGDGNFCATNGHVCCLKNELKNKCELENHVCKKLSQGQTCESIPLGKNLGTLGCTNGETCCEGYASGKNACQLLEGTCVEESKDCESGKVKSLNSNAADACNMDTSDLNTYKCCVKRDLEDLKKCTFNSGTCKDECPSGLKESTSTQANEGCKNYYGNNNFKCCTSPTTSDPVTPGKVKMESFDWDYPNPLGVDSFTQWISNLLASIQGIVAWLAVLMIFIGGIMYILSGGSQSQATLAKDIIKWALVGFALAVAAPALLKEIKELVSSGTGSAADLIDKANTFKKIVTNILSFLLTIVGTLSLIGMAVGGGMYLFSGGSDQSQKAKKMILYSVIAFSVSSAGIIILNAIIRFLSASKKI